MSMKLLCAPILALGLVLTLAVAVTPLLSAQEQTAGPIVAVELAPGVSAEVFAGAPSDRAPQQTVYLARFVFEPGAEIFPHSHPGTVVLGVQSGSFGWTLVEGAEQRPAPLGRLKTSPNRARR